MTAGSNPRPASAGAVVFLGTLFLLAAAVACQAEDLDAIFPDSELSFGKKISREECVGLKYAVWVEHEHGTECLRYYPSARVDDAKHVVFYLSGDLLKGSVPVNYGKLSASTLMSTVREWEKAIRMPIIYLARPGTYGSSGTTKSEGSRRKYTPSMQPSMRSRQGTASNGSCSLGNRAAPP